jgi:glycosyltransferase involved in cell wall biosynthesis
LEDSLNIFAYHNSYNGVSAYRVWQPFKFIKALGEDVRLLPKRLDRVEVPIDGKGNVPNAESHTAITKWADVIFSNFRTAYNDTARLVAQAQLKPVIIDIDDDFVNLPKWFPTYREWQGGLDGLEPMAGLDLAQIAAMKAQGWGEVVYKGERHLLLPNPPKADLVKDQVKTAAMLTVSTRRLAEVYAGWNKNIQVIPNSVDFDLWPANKKHDDGLIRIGLFGSNTHGLDWREAYDAIEKVLAENPNVRLCFNSWVVLDEPMDGKPMSQTKRHHQFPQGLVDRKLHENPQVEIFEPCEIEEYPAWLAGMGVDIGLAPLANETFNRAKSNIKYLEFGTLGIPGIYADLDPYDDVNHGVTGFKAGKPADYYKFLNRLVKDEALRKQMGQAARLDVEKRYNQKDTAAKLLALITECKEKWTNEKTAA